jgi:hypothetical protein
VAAGGRRPFQTLRAARLRCRCRSQITGRELHEHLALELGQLGLFLHEARGNGLRTEVGAPVAFFGFELGEAADVLAGLVGVAVLG